MKNRKFKHIILKTADYLETAIAVLLVITVIVLAGKLVLDMLRTGPEALGGATMEETLSYCFSLVIGIEFVRMLLKHSAGSIVEIVLFSVARGMIVEHQDGYETVFIIFALVLVFIIRKHLLLPDDTDKEELEE